MNRSLKILFLYNAIFISTFYLLGPLFAVYVQGFTSGVISISVASAVYLLSTATFTLLISKYGDMVKEKEYLLLGGYLVRAVMWACFIFTKSIQTIIIFQALLGIGEALWASSFNALFAEHLDKNKYIYDYADWNLVSTLVGAVSTVIGGFIVSRFGFNYLFATMSILAFIPFVGIITKPRKLL